MNQSQARALIVEYGQRLWTRRLVAGSSGNLSIRLDDGDLVVTPTARSLGSLQPDDLVLVDASGALRCAQPARATSELPLHLAAYRARADIACVIHTHPTFCVVWSKSGALFPRDTVGASESLGTIAWTPYRPNGSADLAALCAERFAAGIDTVLMERHGLSAVGPSLEAAFLRTDQAEEAARVGFYSRLARWNDACGEKLAYGEGLFAP